MSPIWAAVFGEWIREIFTGSYEKGCTNNISFECVYIHIVSIYTSDAGGMPFATAMNTSQVNSGSDEVIVLYALLFLPAKSDG